MGGDDLGSDDEYLQVRVGSDNDDDSSDDNESNDGYNNNHNNHNINESTNAALKLTERINNNNKRKRQHDDEGDDEDNNNNDNDNVQGGKEIGDRDSSSDPTKQEKTSNSSSGIKLMIEAGRSIERQPVSKQAKFLWTVLSHYHLLSSSGSGGISSSSINTKLLPSHFVDIQQRNQEQQQLLFVDQLRTCIVSNKRLKNWKHIRSPMIIIVCLSARRAVEVVKNISSKMKIRILKLFAKHMEIEQQQQMLHQSSFGIAVGTPHRLNVLAQSGALCLDHTQLVILDSHTNAKAYTVCTLPDTAPHCMEFVRDQVLPQLDRNNNNNESKQNNNKKKKKRKKNNKGNDNAQDTKLKLAFI